MESKCNKSRIVMMADNVTEMCRQYDDTVSKIMPGRELFLPNSEGNIYGKVGLNKTFRIVKAKAGVGASGQHSHRLYDFRHLYVKHTLKNFLN